MNLAKAILTAAALAAAATAGLGTGTRAAGQAPAASPSPSREEKLAREACTGCHALPPPDTLPRHAWTAKIYEMVGLMMTGVGAPDQAIPRIWIDLDVNAVERFYASRAPVALASPVPWPPAGEGSPRFTRLGFALAGGGAAPAVAHVRFLDLDGDGTLEIVAVEMTRGLVLRGSPFAPQRGLTVIERLSSPCHFEVVDLDRDGRLDLVVADLGEVPPSDHLKGSVVWLQRLEDGGYRRHVLASGLPRVADVQAADFDADGDLDLAVAAFGWREVGSVLLLENRTRDWSRPIFAARTLDRRSGAIHVPPLDLDKDGRTDFIALLAQHHETVVAFLNSGAAGFRRESLYTAPHPSWGSSGIHVTDLDGDGDLDVILSHGDMLDDFMLKPYHGIQWLENRGTFPFTEHALAPLSGVHGARAVDLDGDGDLDIVAVAFVPAPGRADRGPAVALPSLVWLEQVARGRFDRRTLKSEGRHVSVDAADYDGDGDMDLVVGNFGVDTLVAVELWENLRVTRPRRTGAPGQLPARVKERSGRTR